MANAPLIPRRPDGVPAQGVTFWPEEGDWRISHTLWNQQQQFDARLHEERQLLLPQDIGDDSAALADNVRRWVLGMAFAFLEELGELIEAKEANNADEETVDALHFVLSLACKVGLNPKGLGRFEDRFKRAAKAAGERDWQEVLDEVLPHYVMAISDLKGGHHKWWKNQEAQPSWAPQVDALLRIDHYNLMVASRVFDSAELMFERYMGKVEENHARQRGEIADRVDYAGPNA